MSSVTADGVDTGETDVHLFAAVARREGRRTEAADEALDETFAAPRVSGYAAILRQKFPNLSAAQTASILPDTAQWHAAWGPKGSATQAAHGQGEANLGRALAPVGSLR